MVSLTGKETCRFPARSPKSRNLNAKFGIIEDMWQHVHAECRGCEWTSKGTDPRLVHDGYLQIADDNGNVYAWDPTEKVATRPLVWNSSTFQPFDFSTSYYTHDGNKNVSEVVCANGEVTAHYEYAPFGAVTDGRGASALSNPWRFSSEYAEDDTATVYYNYRHYEPVAGRWLTRDRIDEPGGIMLYGMLCNNTISQADKLGDNPLAVLLIAALVKVVEHDACNWYAEQGLDNESDAYKHCMVSCRYSKCTSLLSGKIGGAIQTLAGGLVHELMSRGNTWEGAIDDMKSNLLGVMNSLLPGQSCEDGCKCEKGKWNR